MSPSIVLEVIGGTLTLLGLLTAAFVVLKSTLSKTTSQLWQQEAEALQARLATVEQSDHDCKARLQVLENANKVLADQVSGTTAVTMLSEQLDKQHEASVKNQEEVLRLLRALAAK